MLCTRCSHPLMPRADRCLRCFALNPQNRPEQGLAPHRPRAVAKPAQVAPAPRPRSVVAPDPSESLPASGRLDFRFDSDPPLAFRATAELEDDAHDALVASAAAGPQLGLFPLRPAATRATAVAPAEAQAAQAAEDAHDPHDAITEPPEMEGPGGPLGRAEAGQLHDSLRRAVAGDAPASAPAAATSAEPAAIAKTGAATAPGPGHAASPALQLPTRAARLAAWLCDGALLLACAALHVALAAALLGASALAPAGPQSVDTWADLLLLGRRLPLLWAALAACLSLAYSWLFTAVGGRTPGMWLARLRLVRAGCSGKEQVSAARALVRAALALPSLLLGLFGFVLALCDARGQTLHDKLSGCLVIADR